MTTLTTEALIALLRADTALMTLCPDGVWEDEAPENATRFVIVSLVVGFDEQMFGGRALEDLTYLVKAVMLRTAGGNIAVAASRIDLLLHQKPLTVPGASVSVMRRVERIRETERDEIDPSIMWFHRGGRFEVVVSL